MIAGMPGIGGSLGRCQLCGNRFSLEVLTNTKVAVIQIPGMNCGSALHQKCRDVLEKHRHKPWQELPDGPIRKAFEQASQ